LAVDVCRSNRSGWKIRARHGFAVQAILDYLELQRRTQCCWEGKSHFRGGEERSKMEIERQKERHESDIREAHEKEGTKEPEGERATGQWAKGTCDPGGGQNKCRVPVMIGWQSRASGIATADAVWTALARVFGYKGTGRAQRDEPRRSWRGRRR